LPGAAWVQQDDDLTGKASPTGQIQKALRLPELFHHESENSRPPVADEMIEKVFDSAGGLVTGRD